MYDGAFSTGPYVTLAYSEFEAYSELCQISIMENFVQTMCNPSIFKTLTYSESKLYSKYCQTYIMEKFIQNLV